MNTLKPDRPDRKMEVICHCSGTTRRQITELVDDGIDNPQILSRMTGATAGCGACETAMLDLLTEYARLKAKTVDSMP